MIRILCCVFCTFLLSCQQVDRKYKIIEVTDTIPITRNKWRSGKRILREQSGKDTIGYKEIKRCYRVYDKCE